MDQPAAPAGGERTGATLIYAGRCLKVIDKFRFVRSFKSKASASAKRLYPLRTFWKRAVYAFALNNSIRAPRSNNPTFSALELVSGQVPKRLPSHSGLRASSPAKDAITAATVG